MHVPVEGAAASSCSWLANFAQHGLCVWWRVSSVLGMGCCFEEPSNKWACKVPVSHSKEKGKRLFFKTMDSF